MARPQHSGRRSTPTIPLRTFILDNGASTIKAGFAPETYVSNEECLKACEVLPNCIVRSRERKTYIAAQSDEITQWGEAIFRRPMENGQLVNWEAEKEIWEYSFLDQKTASKPLYIGNP